jgi:hypothetical protein
MKYSVSLEQNHATVDIYGVALKNKSQRVILKFGADYSTLNYFGTVSLLPEEMNGETLDGNVLCTIEFEPFENVIVEIHN